LSRIIVGSGDFTYEVQSFGRIHAGLRWGRVSNVAVDSEDRVYLYQRMDPPIIILDKGGRLVGSWGEGLLVDGHGIFITPNDDVFLVARGVHEVLKFDTEGKVLLRMGNRERPSFQSPFNHPTDVAVSQSGEIYVTDGYGNSCVHKFSPDGELLLSWGKPGVNPGEFSTPHGVWVDNEEKVYVVDRENNRVQVFDSEGVYINEWRNFYHPMDIYMDAEGVFYVTDQTPRLTVLNAEGKMMARGFAPDAGHGIYGDSQGDLYLADLQKGFVKLSRVR
jgi:peptidylglycine monooxygenase